MVQGIKISEVTDWLLGHIDGLAAPLSFELISGGRSNLTYAVTGADGRKIVLRRPPVSHVLSTAHDMAREYRVISALRDTDVPVAPALAFCADEAVNDRPFYLMEFVDGYVLRDVAGTEAVLDEARRKMAGEQLISATSRAATGTSNGNCAAGTASSASRRNRPRRSASTGRSRSWTRYTSC